MLGDTLATVTTGTAAFSSTATVTSPGGQYAIDGSGLTLVTSNYLLAQAAANASALAIAAEPSSPASASVVTDTATTIQTATSSTNSTPPPATSSTESDGTTTLVMPILQIVTVGNGTVQKPAEQVMQVERPKGRMLVCRG